MVRSLDGDAASSAASSAAAAAQEQRAREDGKGLQDQRDEEEVKAEDGGGGDDADDDGEDARWRPKGSAAGDALRERPPPPWDLLEESNFLRLCCRGRSNVYSTSLFTSSLPLTGVETSRPPRSHACASERAAAAATAPGAPEAPDAWAPSSSGASSPRQGAGFYGGKGRQHRTPNQRHSYVKFEDLVDPLRPRNGEHLGVRWAALDHCSGYHDPTAAPPPPPPDERERKHLLVSSQFGWTMLVSSVGRWEAAEMSPAEEDGEIISVHALEAKSTHAVNQGKGPSRSLIVAAAFVRQRESTVPKSHVSPNTPPNSTASSDLSGYRFNLRIYGASTVHASIQGAVSRMRRDCRVVALPSAPTVITRVRIGTSGSRQNGLIVCGCDAWINLYSLAPGKREPIREEVLRDHFPTLSDLTKARSTVFALEVLDLQSRRVTAAGCNDGTLQLSIAERTVDGGYDVAHQRRHTVTFFTPVTSVTLFEEKEIVSAGRTGGIQLFVTEAAGVARVYRNIESKGLTAFQPLPRSDEYDAVLCAHVADVDCDGTNEIFLGTYGRQLLAYRSDAEEARSISSSAHYKYQGRRPFPGPIYGIKTLDLNGDGLAEVVVVSIYGIHIFQASVNRARSKILEVLETLRDLDDLRARLDFVESPDPDGLSDDTPGAADTEVTT